MRGSEKGTFQFSRSRPLAPEERRLCFARRVGADLFLEFAQLRRKLDFDLADRLVTKRTRFRSWFIFGFLPRKCAVYDDGDGLGSDVEVNFGGE